MYVLICTEEVLGVCYWPFFVLNIFAHGLLVLYLSNSRLVTSAYFSCLPLSFTSRDTSVKFSSGCFNLASSFVLFNPSFTSK